MVLLFLFSAHRLVVVYIIPSFVKISKRVFFLIEQARFSYQIFQRGCYSAKNVSGFTVLVLCTSSDSVL